MPDKYPTLYFISGNKNKYEEFRSLLGLADLRMAAREVLEIQTRLLEILARKKVEEVQASMPGLPFFVEHSGLEIRALKGLPGGLTSEFMDTVGNEGICRMLQAWPNERGAQAVAVIGYSSPAGRIELFRGEIAGSITHEPRGKQGFGWDPIFLPDGSDKTYAEMTADEKNRLSMRTVAAGKFYTSVLRHKFEVTGRNEETVPEVERSSRDLVKLQQTILLGFSESELMDLCFVLHIEYEDLPGGTRIDKVRETVMYVSRRGLVDDLVNLCRARRPNLDWD